MTTRSLGLSTVVRAAPNVLASRFDDEVVLLHLGSGVYFGLDGPGARVWSLIRRPIGFGAIRDTLVAEYAVTRARCTADLRHLLAQMVKRGLAVVEEP